MTFFQTVDSIETRALALHRMVEMLTVLADTHEKSLHASISADRLWRKSRNELDAKRVAERRAQILAFLSSQTEPQPIPAIAAYMKASHATPKTYCHQLMAEGLIGRVIGSAKGQHLWYYIGGKSE